MWRGVDCQLWNSQSVRHKTTVSNTTTIVWVRVRVIFLNLTLEWRANRDGKSRQSKAQTNCGLFDHSLALACVHLHRFGSGLIRIKASSLVQVCSRSSSSFFIWPSLVYLLLIIIIIIIIIIIKAKPYLWPLVSTNFLIKSFLVSSWICEFQVIIPTTKGVR